MISWLRIWPCHCCGWSSVPGLRTFVCYGCGKKKKFVFICLFVYFLGLHLWHVEVPRLGVELELQLPACTTATATLDLNFAPYTTAYSNVGSLTH